MFWNKFYNSSVKYPTDKYYFSKILFCIAKINNENLIIWAFEPPPLSLVLLGLLVGLKSQLF